MRRSEMSVCTVLVMVSGSVVMVHRSSSSTESVVKATGGVSGWRSTSV